MIQYETLLKINGEPDQILYHETREQAEYVARDLSSLGDKIQIIPVNYQIRDEDFSDILTENEITDLNERIQAFKSSLIL